MKNCPAPAFALLALASCAAAAAATAAAAADSSTGEVKSPGQSLFEERCGGCHLEGGFGTRVLARRVPEGQAELANRDILPTALTITVVRRGMGSMPQIREAELDDARLQAIARYLDKSQ